MNEVIDKARDGLINRARAYATADRSDPFAFNRAMAHINSGVATPMRSIEPYTAGDYSADLYWEEAYYKSRDGLIVTYHLPRYRNIARP